MDFKRNLKRYVKKSMKVAADIGSEKHYILFRHPGGREKRILPIRNNREGFDFLYQQIEEQRINWNIETIVFGMESTGNYNDGIGNYLTEKGIKVVLVNGYHTKRIKEISDNSPLKSDNKDPGIIADLMDLGHVMEYWKPEGPAASLRYLNQFREKVIKKRTIAINQIKDTLVLLFPEFTSVFKEIKSKTALWLILQGYHDPDRIINSKKEFLVKEIKRVSRGQKQEREVAKLINAANNTIGIREGKSILIKEIEWLAKDISRYNKEIQDIEKEMLELTNRIKYSKYLFSIPGIGLITVAGLIGEIGDFKRFNNIKELEKYAGLNLFEVSSGKHKGQRHISKRGRCYLRKILYLASLSQVRCNLPIKNWYKNMQNAGKNVFSCLIAVSRKVLRICYGIIKNETEYNPEILYEARAKKLVA